MELVSNSETDTNHAKYRSIQVVVDSRDVSLVDS